MNFVFILLISLIFDFEYNKDIKNYWFKLNECQKNLNNDLEKKENVLKILCNEFDDFPVVIFAYQELLIVYAEKQDTANYLITLKKGITKRIFKNEEEVNQLTNVIKNKLNADFNIKQSYYFDNLVIDTAEFITDYISMSIQDSELRYFKNRLHDSLQDGFKKVIIQMDNYHKIKLLELFKFNKFPTLRNESLNAMSKLVQILLHLPILDKNELDLIISPLQRELYAGNIEPAVIACFLDRQYQIRNLQPLFDCFKCYENEKKIECEYTDKVYVNNLRAKYFVPLIK